MLPALPFVFPFAPLPMKPERIAEALVQAARSLGMTVRYERGAFRGGLCVVEGQAVVVLNRGQPVEVHLAVLAESLRGATGSGAGSAADSPPADALYLKPAVRTALERLWSEADPT